MKYKYHIHNLPKPLDNETLYDYLVLLNKGQTIYRNKIISHNLSLIIKTIENYFDTYYYDADDLFQIGCIGLIKAVDTFKIDKNVLFSTYATHCIKNEILMYLNKYNKTMKANKLINDEDNIYCLNLPEEKYIDNELYYELNEIIKNKLSLKESFIIKSYFGFNNKNLSQQEIADTLNVSQSYLSRLLRNTLKKIKSYLNENDKILEKTYKLK